LHRRHLSESQRALLAAQLKPLFEEEAWQRQRGVLKHASEPLVGLNLGQRDTQKNVGRSAQQAALLMKVSRASVNAADKVKKQGLPQLLDAVMAGKLSVSAAARIAALPAEQQRAVVAGIERGLKPKQALAETKDRFVDNQPAWVDDEGRPLPEGVIPAFRQRGQLRALGRRREARGRDVH